MRRNSGAIGLIDTINATLLNRSTLSTLQARTTRRLKSKFKTNETEKITIYFLVADSGNPVCFDRILSGLRCFHPVNQNGPVFLVAIDTLHAVIADFVGVQVASVALAALDAVPVIQYAFLHG